PSLQFHDGGTSLLVRGNAVYRRCDYVEVETVDEESRVAERFWDGGTREGQFRDAEVHGFEKRNAESLMLAKRDKDTCHSIIRHQLRSRDVSGEHNGIL